MKMNELKPNNRAFVSRKRVGRGTGSGHGKTACRGHKGQKSRSGGKVNPYFEGGQMPFVRRVPKRGFKNFTTQKWHILNLKDLNRFEDETEVTRELLVRAGIIDTTPFKIKVLAQGELKRKLTVEANAFSEKAKTAIEQQGGKAEVV